MATGMHMDERSVDCLVLGHHDQDRKVSAKSVTMRAMTLCKNLSGYRELLNMVSVTSASRYITSASRYHPRFQGRSSMYIRGLIPRSFAEFAEAVPIERMGVSFSHGGLRLQWRRLFYEDGRSHFNMYTFLLLIIKSIPIILYYNAATMFLYNA